MVLFNDSEVSRYEFKGYEIVCSVCQHDLFCPKEAELPEAKWELPGLDQDEGSVVYLICNACGHIHWFYQDGVVQENGDSKAESKITAIVEDDYEEYVSKLDSRAVKDILANIDRDKYPRKYRILKKALGKSD